MDYYNSINSQEFTAKLNILNNSLSRSLINKGFESVLIGNLFYDHLEHDFQNHKMNSLLEEKRKRLFDVSRKCSTAFEVGVNGGHSAFIMLYSNPLLKYFGNDIAEFYEPEPRCHPEVYVPVAFDILKSIFAERVETIKGDCLIELPIYAKANNTRHIDLLHLDGHKETYERDFFTMLPLMKPGGYVVFDDTQQPKVQKLVDILLSKKLVKRCEYSQMSSDEIYKNEIVIIV
jgi:hypothetical protein